jgi:hypothetical protein
LQSGLDTINASLANGIANQAAQGRWVVEAQGDRPSIRGIPPLGEQVEVPGSEEEARATTRPLVVRVGNC